MRDDSFFDLFDSRSVGTSPGSDSSPPCSDACPYQRACICTSALLHFGAALPPHNAAVAALRCHRRRRRRRRTTTGCCCTGCCCTACCTSGHADYCADALSILSTIASDTALAWQRFGTGAATGRLFGKLGGPLPRGASRLMLLSCCAVPWTRRHCCHSQMSTPSLDRPAAPSRRSHRQAVYRHVCRHVYRHVLDSADASSTRASQTTVLPVCRCVDMLIDMCINMCIDMRTGMQIDMRYRDARFDMRV